MLPIVQKFYKEIVQDMDNNKLDTITNLFEEKEIRSIWNSEKEEYFFSVVDVVSALTDSNDQYIIGELLNRECFKKEMKPSQIVTLSN